MILQGFSDIIYVSVLTRMRPSHDDLSSSHVRFAGNRFDCAIWRQRAHAADSRWCGLLRLPYDISCGNTINFNAKAKAPATNSHARVYSPDQQRTKKQIWTRRTEPTLPLLATEHTSQRRYRQASRHSVPTRTCVATATYGATRTNMKFLTSFKHSCAKLRSSLARQ